MITLRSATRKVTVKLGPRSLKESAAMLTKAKHKTLKSLALKVAVRNAKGRSHSLTVRVTKLHLSSRPGCWPAGGRGRGPCPPAFRTPGR